MYTFYEFYKETKLYFPFLWIHGTKDSLEKEQRLGFLFVTSCLPEDRLGSVSVSLYSYPPHSAS